MKLHVLEFVFKTWCFGAFFPFIYLFIWTVKLFLNRKVRLELWGRHTAKISGLESNPNRCIEPPWHMVTCFFRWAKLPPLICIFVTVMSWYACHHTVNAVLNLYSHISARAGLAHIFHSSDLLLALRGKLPSSPSGIDFYSGCFEHCISLL